MTLERYDQTAVILDPRTPTAYGQKIIATIREASATRPAGDIRPRRPRKTTPA
jgi:hypothetical protein